MNHRDKKFHRVRNLRTGGIYILDEQKLRSEPLDWELAPMGSEPKAPVVEKEGILSEIDVDLNEVFDDVDEAQAREEEEEISYADMKLLLEARGVDFKGNASKQTLAALLKES